MNKIIYSSIVGKKDILIRDFENYDNVKYVLFSDNEYEPHDPWEVRKINQTLKDPVRQSRLYKILPHQFIGAEYTMWIDGNIKPLDTIHNLVNKYLSIKDIALFRHPMWNCTYKQSDSCIKCKLDDEKTIKNHMLKYKERGYPEDSGCYAGCVILRRNTPKIRRFNEMWWSEYSTGSRRDQCSLTYCLNKLGIEPAVIDGFPDPKYNKECREFTYFKHIK